MDPHAVLGLAPGASPDEVTAAYRRLAKTWHPDRAVGPEAALRMAQINAAYDLVRELAEQPAAPVTTCPENGTGTVARATPREAGAWLDPAVRRALGRELVQALAEGEPVAYVTPVATWASPSALLAVTDRRLLWLLDDAVSHRIRSLGFRAIAAVDHRLRRPLRRSAVLRVRTTSGRRLAFAELEPATAAAIERHVAAAGAPPG